MSAFGRSYTYSFDRFGDFYRPDYHTILIKNPLMTAYKRDLISILAKINYISENISAQTNDDIITYLKLTLKRVYTYRVDVISKLNSDTTDDKSCIGAA